MHNAVICVIAKNENIYINEWVEYNLALGFDHIYIYDNNTSKTEFVGNFIKNKDKVTIININDDYRYHLQTFYFKAFYKEYKNTFNWVAFIDIDEFIDLNNEYKDINEFLNQEKFKDINQILIKWKLFGDDGLIERDLSIPVHEFFKIPVSEIRPKTNLVKAIIKGNIATELLGSHGHHIHFVADENDKPWEAAFPSGKKLLGTYQLEPGQYLGETIFINHYITKTLSEFLTYKWPRGDIFSPTHTYTLQYYTAVNNWTPAHAKYFKDWNNQNFKKWKL